MMMMNPVKIEEYGHDGMRCGGVGAATSLSKGERIRTRIEGDPILLTYLYGLLSAD